MLQNTAKNIIPDNAIVALPRMGGRVLFSTLINLSLDLLLLLGIIIISLIISILLLG